MGEKRSLVETGGYHPGRSVVKRGEIRLKPSSIKGLYIGQIIGPETGCYHATTTLDLYHIPPGVKTARCRQDEILLHVLNGEGHSIIEGEKYEWERGDSIHIKPGYWHEHWNTSKTGANMIAARITPLINYVKEYGFTYIMGGPYTPVNGTVPDHPFGLGKVPPVIDSDPEWPGRPYVKWMRKQYQEWELKRKEGRTIMKGKDIRWEVEATHGGEWNTQLLDGNLGFDTRTVTFGMQAMVPGGCNETHVHGEAIVYTSAGKGYVLVSGEKFDLEEGDCVFVHHGQPHQFCSTSGPNDPLFTQIRVLTLQMERYLFPFPHFEEEENPALPDFDPSYVPQLPW